MEVILSLPLLFTRTQTPLQDTIQWQTCFKAWPDGDDEKTKQSFTGSWWGVTMLMEALPGCCTNGTALPRGSGGAQSVWHKLDYLAMDSHPKLFYHYFTFSLTLLSAYPCSPMWRIISDSEEQSYQQWSLRLHSVQHLWHSSHSSHGWETQAKSLR